MRFVASIEGLIRKELQALAAGELFVMADERATKRPLCIRVELDPQVPGVAAWVWLGGDAPMTVSVLRGADAAAPCIAVPIRDLRTMISADVSPDADIYRPGNLFVSDAGATVLVQRRGLGGQTDNYHLSLSDWTVRRDPPNLYAFFTEWDLIEGSDVSPTTLYSVRSEMGG